MGWHGRLADLSLGFFLSADYYYFTRCGLLPPVKLLVFQCKDYILRRSYLRMCTSKSYQLRKGTINGASILGAQSSFCKLSPASWVVTMATLGLILSMSPTLCLSSHSSHTTYLDISPDCGEEQILFPWYPLAQVQACICLQ